MSADPFSHIRCAVRSEIGLKRKNNEDAHGEFPASGVWCVADGMGGGDDGEIASAAVIREISAFCASRPMDAARAYSGECMAEGVIRAVNRSSQWIFSRAVEKSLKGCGSTFVGVVFDAGQPDAAIALHAGDSRLYRLRGRDCRQITRDHSAAELIGEKDESKLNPIFCGMILRAVGVNQTVDVDVTPFDVCEGDTILICSDGLSKMVPDRQISALVRQAEGDVEEAVSKLIKATYDAGAVDNVTIQVLRVGPLPAPRPTLVAFEEDTSTEDPDTDGSERPTGDTFAGTASDLTCAETIDGTGGRRTEVTDVFRVADDGPDSGGVRQDSRRWWRRKGPWIAVGSLLLAGLLAWHVRDVLRGPVCRPVDAVTTSGLVAPTGDAVRTGGGDQPIAAVTDRQNCDPEPLVTTASVAVVSSPESSPEDREREILLERLKAKRRHVRQDEIRVQREDLVLNEALGRFIRSCRGAAFEELVARVSVASGRRYGDRLRLLGRRLAAMRPENENAGSAASDLVAELQKALAAQRKGSSALSGFAGIADRDTMSADVFSVCADAIAALSANGQKTVR